MSLIHRVLLAFTPVVIAVTAMSCSTNYRPGLGELMNFTQMRHAKLWFAGQEQNWQLARYELDDLRAVITAHDNQSFVAAYDGLTAGCNSCHQATNFGFNVVKRPSGASWFSNQAFAGGQ